MIVIKPLSGVSPEELYGAFNEAFKYYVRSWTQDEFENMIRRRGFEPDFSFGAFDNNKLVSFTLNAIGLFNDKKTAYDTATGTIETYRGKGLATKIFEAALPTLKKAGCTKYLLETLTGNEKAISVYKKLGFAISRELNYFVKEVKDLESSPKLLPDDLTLKDIGLEYKKQMMTMFDFNPSWQNNFEIVNRRPGTFKITGAFLKNELVGYFIFETASGDVPQLAVHKANRRKGIGTALFNNILKFNEAGVIKLLNVETSCEAMTAFLRSKNIAITGSQVEMIKDLQ